MKKLVIFDMDGTIADTSPGIYGSIRYTQKKMGLPEISPGQMRSHVGPPMEESYARNFGLTGDKLKEAISYHKEYAMKQGYRELKVYDGIPELLSDIREKGIRTAVATLKTQTAAEKILQEYRLNYLFDIVIGTNSEHPVKKSDMLLECMDRLSCGKPDTVLIGDSRYDAEAAYEAGIAFIAVTYGFGFNLVNDVKNDCIGVCDSVENISDILFNLN